MHQTPVATRGFNRQSFRPHSISSLKQIHDGVPNSKDEAQQQMGNAYLHRFFSFSKPCFVFKTT